MFVGGRTDPAFGPVMLVGFGGVLADLADDVRVLPAPTTPEAVRHALRGLRLAALFDGYRGAPPVQLDALAGLVARLSAALAASDRDLTLELNPVRLIGARAIVLDAKTIAPATPPGRGA